MLKGIMERVLWVGVALLMVSNVYAVAPGFYIGLQAGVTGTKAKNVMAIVTDDPFVITTPARPQSSRQIGGRLYLGYKWNRWFAAELGGWAFSFLKYKTSVPTCGDKSELYLGLVDLTFKPTFTLGPLDAYLKLGGAANYQVNSASLNQGVGATCEKRTSTWRFGGLIGIGTNFELTQNWVADLEYTHVQIGGNFIKYINFVSIGIAYHIVDRYCGQFLCDE